MDKSNLHKLQAREIAERVNSRDLKPFDVAETFARRTQNLVSSLNSHIDWDYDAVMRDVEKQCDYIEAAIAVNKPLPLAGVPIAVKDNIAQKSKRLTCGSRILDQFISPYSATVIKKLEQAGAFLMGRTNMDEFAMGSSSENSAFGPALNPWNTSCVTGGSSGGSASAVAASMAPLSIGSDTGGSIRQPASFCGIAGLKPTYGRVSRFGLVSYASSFDQIGPFGKSCEDVALLYDVIAGFDPLDSTSFNGHANSAFEAIENVKGRDLSGWRIGVLQIDRQYAIDEAVDRSLKETVTAFEQLGAEIIPVSLPILSYATAAYYVMATAEASSNLARYDGIRFGYRASKPGISLADLYRNSRSEGFGKEVKQRIMLGTFALSSGYYDDYYLQALKYRQLLTNELNQLFNDIDVLVSPTAPSGAYALGAMGSDSVSIYQSDIFTVPANLTGCPAISLPFGLDERKLPIGIQMTSARYQEDKLLQCGYLFEQAIQWMDKYELRI